MADRRLIQGQRALSRPSASQSCQGYADNMGDAQCTWGFNEIFVNQQNVKSV